MATEPVDFRKGHNDLAALVQNHLHKDPFTIARQEIAQQSAERGHGLCVLPETGRLAEAAILERIRLGHGV